jgi:FMN phosphatase YigB (HAD superfamily)
MALMELPGGAIEPTRWQVVIFDLWETLVDFPWDLAEAHFAAMAGRLAVDAGRLPSTWRRLDPA